MTTMLNLLKSQSTIDEKILNHKPLDIPKTLWDYLTRIDTERLKKILIFVRGSYCMPINGILKIQITAQTDPNSKTIYATVCQSRLHIPLYTTKEEVETNIDMCIEHCYGFGLA